MFKNYLKIAWRNLVKNKTHSFINIAGLSIGLACSLLIFLWVQNEYSVDAYHVNKLRLYKVYEREYYDHKIDGNYDTPAIMADELKKVFPEVEYAINMDDENDNNTFSAGGKIIKLNGTYAGADVFKMFSYPLLQGTPQSALTSPADIAISQKMAILFFQSPQKAMGQTIRFENRENFIVTAVFKDLPENSSRHFEYLISWAAYLEEHPGQRKWGNTGPLTFVQLRQGASAALLEKKITHFVDHYQHRTNTSYHVENGLQRFDQVYLHSNFSNGKIEGGRIEYVNIFSLVAVFILLIACINFMNLTTARSVKRAREIGVRKVLGAARWILIKQFISESLVFTVIAVVAALIIMTVLLPAFNYVTQKQIAIPFDQLSFWLKLLALTLITGLISGSYPALFLSSFKPVKVLKGTLKFDAGTVFLRKGLVVFQFVLSSVLIIATVIISRQVNYIQNRDIGYDKENLIYIPMAGDLGKKYDVFKNEAERQPGILSISKTGISPTFIDNGTIGVNWEGKDPNNTVSFSRAMVGYDFVRTMKLTMMQGRDFSADFPTDTTAYIINQTAAEKMGYTSPVGRSFTLWGQKGKIIGLIKDFHFASLHEKIKPIVIVLYPGLQHGDILVRTQPGMAKQAIATISDLNKQLNPEFPVTYYFSDQQYQKLYQSEQVVGKLSNIFAFLAVFISCLGLLGLAMFTAEQRIKEIGIRKVLGASISSLFALLSSEFLVLTVIAMLIASPLAWYAMNSWLQGFAYHTTVQWWMFALSGGLILLIALTTVSFQAAKAALANPVKSLKTE